MAERASDAAFHDINGEELLQETCGHVAVEHRRFRGDLQGAQDANACGPGKKPGPWVALWSAGLSNYMKNCSDTILPSLTS